MPFRDSSAGLLLGLLVLAWASNALEQHTEPVRRHTVNWLSFLLMRLVLLIIAFVLHQASCVTCMLLKQACGSVD